MEPIRKAFRPLLKEISPGQKYEKIFIPLNQFESLKKFKCERFILHITASKMETNQSGVFFCRKIKDKIFLFIIINERLNKFYHLPAYKRLRKYCIVHEFCHLIALVTALHTEYDINNISSKFINSVKHLILFSELFEIVKDTKNFDNAHFRYKENNVDYKKLFENLLLSTETIREYTGKTINNFRAHMKNKEWNKTREWISGLAKNIAEEKSVDDKFAIKRILEEIQLLIT